MMNISSSLKRAAAGVLAMVMVLSCAGCGGRGSRGSRGSREDAETKTETSAPQATEETAAEVPAVSAGGSFMEDPVVLAHTEHNKRMAIKKAGPRSADKLNFCVENIEGMVGFLSPRSEYQESMQGILGLAYSSYSDLDSYYLSWDSGKVGWSHGDFDGSFFQKAQSERFYEENPLPQTGALSMLFQEDRTPFEENALTVLVSSFMGQGFNLHILLDNIQSYFDQYEYSGACVIGIRSKFAGKLFVPDEMGDGSTFYIDNYEGMAPFYVTLVGPETDVKAFAEDCRAFLDAEEISYGCAVYSNSLYQQIEMEPMTFDLLDDHGEKKAKPPVLSSYNTGVLQHNDENTAFFSTFSSIITRAERGRDKTERDIDVDRTTQISLISRNYDGTADLNWNGRLYRYDQDTEQWVDAGQSANDMVRLICEVVDGPVVDNQSGEIVLSDGRQELYMRAILNFDESSALSRDTTYRLEVSTDLNRLNPEAVGHVRDTSLDDFNVSSKEYYSIISRLCPLTKGNYIWSGTSEITKNKDLLAQANSIISGTPNLNLLLDGLARIEDQYHPDEQRIQYLDFLYNLPNGSSRK